MSRRIYAQGMVASFLPVSGSESEWGERGGNSKSVRNTEILWERLQAEAIALGGPATDPPDRPCPSLLRLRLIEGSVVPDHLEHLRGVRGTRPLNWEEFSSTPPSASTLAARCSRQPQRAAGAIKHSQRCALPGPCPCHGARVAIDWQALQVGRRVCGGCLLIGWNRMKGHTLCEPRLQLTRSVGAQGGGGRGGAHEQGPL
jgi:hypothetical protein